MNSSDKTKILGEKGEHIALSFLLKKGFTLLEKNWRFGKLELDLIMQDQDKIVFIEVKTLENDYLRSPHEAVSKSKQRNIIKAANAYILEKHVDHESRFDIVSVIVNSKEERIEHIEEAFYPTA